MVQWNWRAALLVSALPSLLMAVWWLGIRPPSGARDDREGPREPEVHPAGGRARVVLRLLRTPGFLRLTLSYSLQGYVGYIFIFWFYLYLVQVRHFDLMQGAAVSSLPWVLSIVSIPFGGMVSDRLVRGRLGHVWGRRLVPIVGMAGAGVCIAIGARTGHAYVAAVTLAIATALVLSVEGPFWSTMASLAGDRSGTGGGIMNTGCNLGGLISPMLTPWLAEQLGWEPALYVAAALSVAAALLWFGITPAPPGGNAPA